MPSAKRALERMHLQPPISMALIPLVMVAAGCGGSDGQPGAGGGGGDADMTAFAGATIWDGTGAPAIQDGVLLVQEGRITAIGPADEISVPAGATEVRLDGRWVTPGLINAHGHVAGTAQGDGRVAALAELERYARYGITTVNSLGGEPDAAAPLRDALLPSQAGQSPRARLLMAGAVVTGDTPEAAVQVATENATLGVDYMKIRVDDNLGTSTKMSPEIYRAVIDAAHTREIPLAAHLFYLDDAKDLLRSGADLVAHSVRDQPVDQELIDLLIEADVCYVPTLMREVSTFVYRTRPDFLDDAMLASDVDADQVATVTDPEFQNRMRLNPTAQRYEQALMAASANLKTLSDGGVTIAMGTDTGPLGRFQGYFEHMELGLMVEAGLTPEQALLTATRDAARCIDRTDLGTLAVGNHADFVVYGADPIEDIENTRTRDIVYVGGREVAGTH